MGNKKNHIGLEIALNDLIERLNKVNKDGFNCGALKFYEEFCSANFERDMFGKLSKTFGAAFENSLVAAIKAMNLKAEKNPKFEDATGYEKTGDLLVYRNNSVKKAIFIEIKSTIEFNSMAAAIFQGLLYRKSEKTIKVKGKTLKFEQSRYHILSLYANQNKDTLRNMLRFVNEENENNITWDNLGFSVEEYNEHRQFCDNTVADNLSSINDMFMSWSNYFNDD